MDLSPLIPVFGYDSRTAEEFSMKERWFGSFLKVVAIASLIIQEKFRIYERNARVILEPLT
jgi:hypothetical protein